MVSGNDHRASDMPEAAHRRKHETCDHELDVRARRRLVRSSTSGCCLLRRDHLTGPRGIQSPRSSSARILMASTMAIAGPSQNAESK